MPKSEKRNRKRSHFFLGARRVVLSKSARSVWASVAAPSQTLPMVDGGWGVLQDPNMIWVGHHLGFGAGGLAAGPDRSRRPTYFTIVRLRVLYLLRVMWAIFQQTDWIPA